MGSSIMPADYRRGEENGCKLTMNSAAALLSMQSARNGRPEKEAREGSSL